MAFTQASVTHQLPAPSILQQRFLLAMRMQNCTQRTIEQWTFTLDRFHTWCLDRGIESVTEVTPAVLAAYPPSRSAS